MNQCTGSRNEGRGAEPHPPTRTPRGKRERGERSGKRERGESTYNTRGRREREEGKMTEGNRTVSKRKER